MISFILVSFKMLFHCANKTISSEILMSGDYLRLEGNKGWEISQAQVNLTKKLSQGARIGPVSENCPGVAPSGRWGGNARN